MGKQYYCIGRKQIMFLYGPSLKLPDRLKAVSYSTVRTGNSILDKPAHVIPLNGALWPDKIKKKVTEIFKAIGVPDPMNQKLVEPHARVFGGRCIEGSSILDEVDWKLLLDYFEWEAAALTDPEKSEALQEKCEKKRGGIFTHQPVYEDPFRRGQ